MFQPNRNELIVLPKELGEQILVVLGSVWNIIDSSSHPKRLGSRVRVIVVMWSKNCIGQWIYDDVPDENVYCDDKNIIIMVETQATQQTVAVSTVLCSVHIQINNGPGYVPYHIVLPKWLRERIKWRRAKKFGNVVIQWGPACNPKRTPCSMRSHAVPIILGGVQINAQAHGKEIENIIYQDMYALIRAIPNCSTKRFLLAEA